MVCNSHQSLSLFKQICLFEQYPLQQCDRFAEANVIVPPQSSSVSVSHLWLPLSTNAHHDSASQYIRAVVCQYDVAWKIRPKFCPLYDWIPPPAGRQIQSLSVPGESAHPRSRLDSNPGRLTFAFGSSSRHPLLPPPPPPLASFRMPHIRAHMAVQQMVSVSVPSKAVFQSCCQTDALIHLKLRANLRLDVGLYRTHLYVRA